MTQCVVMCSAKQQNGDECLPLALISGTTTAAVAVLILIVAAVLFCLSAKQEAERWCVCFGYKYHDCMLPTSSTHPLPSTATPPRSLSLSLRPTLYTHRTPPDPSDCL